MNVGIRHERGQVVSCIKKERADGKLKKTVEMRECTAVGWRTPTSDRQNREGLCSLEY